MKKQEKWDKQNMKVNKIVELCSNLKNRSQVSMSLKDVKYKNQYMATVNKT